MKDPSETRKPARDAGRLSTETIATKISHVTGAGTSAKLTRQSELERIVLGYILREGFGPTRTFGLRSSDFSIPVHSEVFVWLERNPEKWIAGNITTCQAALEDAGLAERLGSTYGAGLELFKAVEAFGPAAFTDRATELIQEAIERRRRELAGGFYRGEITNGEFALELNALDTRAASLDAGATASRLTVELDARRFDDNNPPPPTQPAYTLRDMAIATPGNITVIQAQVKAGKTALLGAMIAAGINPDAAEDMTLGVRSPGAEGRAVVHFDCEQSPDDHHALVSNSLRRAGLDVSPANLRSYCLTDMDVRQRLAMLRAELERAGDVFAVFLDGAADLTFGVNDEEEALGLVAELHALAIRYRMALIAVLHENPGINEQGKTRGHLGSQLERKQFAGLRLAKDKDEVTTLWTDRSRKASIPKTRGIRFAYNAEAGLHLPVESANDARAESAKDELIVFAASVFHSASKAGLSWTELRNRIKDMAGLGSVGGARKRMEKMHAAGIIRKNLFNNWELAA